jgi:hypothetical protein
VGSPEVDETDIGNRDPALKSTYKGLPKLRYVSTFTLVIYSLIEFICLFRAACVISWSHKPVHMPSYSGMLEEIPRINKKYIFICCVLLVY